MNRRFLAAALIALLMALSGCITKDFAEDETGSFNNDALNDTTIESPDGGADASGEPCTSADECEGNAHQTGFCPSTGMCRYRCEQGYGDCDGNHENGCEVDITSSTQHCRECFNECEPNSTNLVPICLEDGCDVEAGNCLDGFVNLDPSDPDCECAITDRSDEPGDGEDTDCDGQDG